MNYTPPTQEQVFAMRVCAGIEELAQRKRFEAATPDMVEAIAEGIGQFAAGEWAPLNRPGDLEGAKLENGVVRLPEGFEEAYEHYVEQGWNAIDGPVDYGGQGGLGEIAFLDSQRAATVGSRTIYLSWVEAGEGDTRGAVVGRGTLNCGTEDASCKIEGLETIWRQTPKVTGRGHYSHRIVFSPDERYMFVSSGERQKGTPAQDTSNTLGTIVRLNLDGTAAAGNPLAAQGSPSDQIWSWGHRNILAMDFDAEGRLWEIEHGPAGGDELNLVQKGGNYGWPTRSFGDEYNGTPIPDHTADDGFIKPVIDWTPVIASGNFFIYDGDLFAPWRGQGIIAGLKTQALIRIAFDGDTAREVGRIPMGERIRQVVQGPDGAIWALEDGEGGRLLKLTPG